MQDGMNCKKKFDVERVRADFPIFANRNVIYLDSAATAQKPKCVTEAERDFYESDNANPLRGVYELAGDATAIYEDARARVQRFINARESDEIIFTRNATESLNLVAYSISSPLCPELCLKEGDEILITVMEHHSNLLPWQQAAARTGAHLKYIECDSDGKFSDEQFENAISDRTRLVAMTHISNVLGVCNDIKKYAAMAHERGCLFVADAAQSIPHMPVDVQDLDVDFLAFSGHKLYGPMGIGVLYGREDLLEMMPPFLCGGEMISSVDRQSARFAPLPHKFEAGTVNAAGAAGLAKAMDYVEDIGFEQICAWENHLCELAMGRLADVPGVKILGSRDAAQHHGIISFTLDGVHPHDIATLLDMDHIAVRAGHHCAQPLLQHLGVSSCVRASIAFYNTEEDIDALVVSVGQIRRLMGYGD